MLFLSPSLRQPQYEGLLDSHIGRHGSLASTSSPVPVQQETFAPLFGWTHVSWWLRRCTVDWDLAMANVQLHTIVLSPPPIEPYVWRLHLTCTLFRSRGTCTSTWSANQTVGSGQWFFLLNALCSHQTSD
jgi:hypothetical protein